MYDSEIYQIAYASKTMKEAFEIASEYSKKTGNNFIVSLAIEQASIRLNNKKTEWENKIIEVPKN
jgi:hypothetical protein